MSSEDDIISVIKNHKYFVGVLAIVYILSAITVFFTPRGFAIPELDPIATENPYNYTLFGLSIVAFVLLSFIGGYLTSRFFTKEPPRTASLYQLWWGLSFIIFSITFLGLSLQAWGIEFADMNQAHLFFLWRNPMILWVAGMWIGTIMLFTEDKRAIFLPAFVIILLCEVWFGYLLLIAEITEGTIELAMYGFLFCAFIPMCLVLAYLWNRFGSSMKLTSSKMLQGGFFLMGVSYAAWAPWHFKELVYIYFVWYGVFIMALSFIMAGFYALPKETKAKVLEAELGKASLQE